MKKTTLLNAAMILLALLPAVYLLIIYPSLPQTVPLHFDSDFQPDRTGSKSELWLPVGIMTLVSIGVYFLLTNLHRFDPKQRGAGRQPALQKLAAGMVVFISALTILIVNSAKDASAFQNFLFPLVGLLFAFIGSCMTNIKPNYFAGLRLPWTLNNDENWRRTHLLGSKVWVSGGLLVAVISFFLPPPAALFLFIGATAVMVLIPVVYSYRLFKQGF